MEVTSAAGGGTMDAPVGEDEVVKTEP